MHACMHVMPSKLSWSKAIYRQVVYIYIYTYIDTNLHTIYIDIYIKIIIRIGGSKILLTSDKLPSHFW